MRVSSGWQSGFTLLELMIVAVVIAILAAVAYPSYTSHIKQARRAAVQAQMMDLAGRQQQFLLNNRTFGTLSDLLATGYVWPDTVSSSYTATITVSTTTLPRFTVTATPLGSQAADGVLTLNSEGEKAPAGKWQQ